MAPLLVRHLRKTHPRSRDGHAKAYCCAVKLVSLTLALVLLAGACTGDETGRDDGARSQSSTGQPVPSAGGAPCRDLAELVGRMRRGYVAGPSPDISLIPREPNFVGIATMPPHTGPWDYLTDVPLVFYGPGFIANVGAIDAPATMADVAPTLAHIVGFDDFPKVEGRVLDEALAEGSESPRLVAVVWDGGGFDTLDAHPKAWPFLRSLMDDGASFTEMSIGSTPSNTPPIHATLGTGVFPETHGIVAVKQRDELGELVDPWLNEDPSKLLVPTLGDLYDRARNNRPLVGMTATVNWHLGMIGHGSATSGGDRDQALLLNDQGLPFGNESFYEIPDVASPGELDRFTKELDRSDGAADEQWKGHPLADLALRYATPAYTRYQELMLERMIAEVGFGKDSVADLMFVNFKQPDDAGHQWGMSSPEVEAVLTAQDRELRRLAGFLDQEVGKRRWVLALTADHGQMPYPEESGAWAIGGTEMKNDANAALGEGAELVDRVVAHGAYVNRERMERAGVTLEDIARFFSRYTVGENLKEGSELPAAFENRTDERLMDAAVIGGGKVVRGCSQTGSS